MHCILSYPTQLENANIKAILDIKKTFPNYLMGLVITQLELSQLFRQLCMMLELLKNTTHIIRN